jgi:hypothetical protein
VQDTAGNGASSPLQYIGGSTTNTITFPESYGQPTSSFSMCTVARFVGGAGTVIFQGTVTNFYHGHYQGLTGVGYFSNWATTQANHLTPVTNWVIMCSAFQSGSPILVYLNNGTPAGTGATNLVGPAKLCINTGYRTDYTSNFGVLELITWNVALSTSGLLNAVSYLAIKHGIGADFSTCPVCRSMMPPDERSRPTLTHTC